MEKMYTFTRERDGALVNIKMPESATVDEIATLTRLYQPSMEFIEDYVEKVPLMNIKSKLSNEFIDKYADKLNWYGMIMYQEVSEEILAKYHKQVDWEYASKYANLSEKFIREHEDDIYFSDLPIGNKSDKFLEDYWNRLDFGEYMFWATEKDRIRILDIFKDQSQAISIMIDQILSFDRSVYEKDEYDDDEDD